jgi:oligopeptide transport system ATP-binding protein
LNRPELLKVEGLTKHFPVTRGVLGRQVGLVRAVDDVSFEIARGETLGLVGESGSGKTTAGRSILRLIEPTRGRVLFDGEDVTAADADTLRRLRRSMQIVFQDPYGSLNPRMRVIDLIGEAMEQHGLASGKTVERRVAELLARVGLSPNWINRYPHEFSGGQRQRIGVARAIALEPKLVICDEPVSALDVSIQAQVVNLLRELGRELSLSYLFIAHDLSVVRHISDRVAVMYLGEVVEIADKKRLFSDPSHPYTRALLSAVPVPDPTRDKRRLVLAGDIPSPLAPPSGCRFHTRCPAVFERCPIEAPQLTALGPGHLARCFHAYDLDAGDVYQQVRERIEQRIRRNGQVQAPRAYRADLESRFAIKPQPVNLPRERGSPAAIDPAQRKRRSGFRWIALAVLVLATFVAGRRVYFRAQARSTLRALSQALEARKAIVGVYPSTLHELGYRLPPIFRGGKQVDPWGRPYVYEPPSKPGARPTLASLGADGVPSGDDVRLRP